MEGDVVHQRFSTSVFAVRLEEVGARLAARGRGSKMRSDFKAEARVRMTNIPTGDRTFWRADKVFFVQTASSKGWGAGPGLPGASWA